jgi:hypothetical protein
MTQLNLARMERAIERPAAALMLGLGLLLTVAFALLGGA